MKWKLKIKNFGKIKDAEIHDSSLRFIVGNNNSGKSYLMTLLWGIEKITDDILGDKNDIDLSTWISEENYNQILNGGQYEFYFLDYKDIISCYINLFLQKEKDKLVSKLLNFKNVKIEELSMTFEFEKNEKFMIYNNGIANKKQHEVLTPGACINLYVNSIEHQISLDNIDRTSIKSQRLSVLREIVHILLESIFIGHKDGKAVYLPAARTGFMLTKDIINKTSRRIAFANEENKYEPFTMPIIEFLDAMETINTDINSNIKASGKYDKICDLIEDRMLQGKLLVSDTPNKALRFTPVGTEEKLPLRTTSAVVTEISPLYLLLKNKTNSIRSIYYEEPEMCLHPQLQQVIARVLIELTNAGVNLTTTTHSDIIIQHVNNMIRLGYNSQHVELMQKYGYEKDDLLKALDVSMYQFRENEDGTTTLEELKCGEYGFEVPTFNNALDNILEEVYALQEEEG